MEKGKYYVLKGYHHPQVLKGIINLELKDEDSKKKAYEEAKKSWFKGYLSLVEKRDHKGYFVKNKEFMLFQPVEEPMVFNHNRIEAFTKVPINAENYKHKFHRYTCSERQQKNLPTGVIIECGHKFFNGPFYFEPLLGDYGTIDGCFTEINGTELYRLLNQIKDTNSTMQNPTFNRHINVLHSLFERACLIANLPYRNVAEYHEYIATEEMRRNQSQEQARIQNAKADEQAKQILGKFMK